MDIIEDSEESYRGEGFTGRRPRQMNPGASSVQSNSRSQVGTDVPYCQSCKASAQYLPNGKLWCPECDGGPGVLGQSRLATTGVLFFASTGVLALAIWLLFLGGSQTIEGFLGEKNEAPRSIHDRPISQSAPITNAAPISSDSVGAAPQTSLCLRISVGCQAVVTNTGTWLNLRDAPTVKGTVVDRLHDGKSVVIVGGPVSADNYTWWQIQSLSGGAGWAAEGEKDGARWLAAVSNSSGVNYSQPGSSSDEPEYCQELAGSRASLEAEGLWEGVKRQLEFTPNGAYLSQCSAWD